MKVVQLVDSDKPVEIAAQFAIRHLKRHVAVPFGAEQGAAEIIPDPFPFRFDERDMIAVAGKLNLGRQQSAVANHQAEYQVGVAQHHFRRPEIERRQLIERAADHRAGIIAVLFDRDRFAVK
ncbi:MAG: hypothetical protein ACIALR_01430 [Blastopirellula sp. JB062]